MQSNLQFLKFNFFQQNHPQSNPDQYYSHVFRTFDKVLLNFTFKFKYFLISILIYCKDRSGYIGEFFEIVFSIGLGLNRKLN